MLPTRFLINRNGTPFNKEELESIKVLLDNLTNEEREYFRNENAKEIAQDNSPSTLIVSGPGTGKSFIFLKKIEHWLKNYPTDKVRVISFVRKLVADLQADVTSDKGLSDGQKGQVNVSTLHKLARSVIERNGGTIKRPLKVHSKIVVEQWEKEVWEDVRELNKITEGYEWKEMTTHLHNSQLPDEEKWPELISTFFVLSAYYNAVCFADMVMLAATALAESPDLVEESFFILDEYQDFNQAEDSFVAELTRNAKGILMVGDDDQVLYEKLKSGKAELIRNHYLDTTKTNAMLPYCGRCSFHITRTAAGFINANAEEEDISKVYLPLNNTKDEARVVCVATAKPSGAVDYIIKFIEDNKEEIEERKRQLEEGTKKDAFLLILSPDKKLAFYGDDKDGLVELIKSYQSTQKLKYGEDYYKVLTYYTFGNNSENNYAFRKILTYENISRADITGLIQKGLESRINFIEIDSNIVGPISTKAGKVKEVLEQEGVMAEDKANAISKLIPISDIKKLTSDIEKSDTEEGFKVKYEDEEAAELEEIEPSKANAVDLMSIIGSKGLSADHVIIVGFDNTNMGYVTRNAFYVAMTRARKSLHILTALQCRGSSGPHDFFQALPEAHLQFAKHVKTNSVTTAIASKTDFIGYFRKIAYARNNPRPIK